MRILYWSRSSKRGKKTKKQTVLKTACGETQSEKGTEKKRKEIVQKEKCLKSKNRFMNQYQGSTSFPPTRIACISPFSH